MRQLTHVANPFAMLLDPESIAREVEASERLRRLHSRVCRPLDKPLIATRRREAGADLDAYDAQIDASADEDCSCDD